MGYAYHAYWRKILFSVKYCIKIADRRSVYFTRYIGSVYYNNNNNNNVECNRGASYPIYIANACSREIQEAYVHHAKAILRSASSLHSHTSITDITYFRT
jgi:hypothetical protein